MRTTLLLTTSKRTATANVSKISILSIEVNSQGRAVKAYGMEVNAPTGHRSMILPDSSSMK